MKRCPLCDFLYEDDQRLCDMDGIELVPESVALLAPAQVTVRGPGGWRMARRRLLVLLLVGLVLAGGAVAVYHLSADRAAAGPALAATPVPSPTPAPTPAPVPAESLDAAESETADPPARPSPAPARPRAVRQKEAQPRPASESRKNESKVGSLLKKTGRVLKKPFKF